MTSTFKQKVVSGVFWQGLERISTQIIAFVTSIVLARLLEPKDFGTVALLGIFIALASCLVNSGFGMALIQKETITEKDLNSVFYLSVGVSILLYGVLYLCAPLIAAFYVEPVLVPVLRWTALSLIFNAISGMQNAVLQREMRFKLSFQISLVSLISSGTVGIALAYWGYGLWALVFSTLTGLAVGTVVRWVVVGWWPQMIFCSKTVRELFKFSSKMLASSLLDTFFVNIYGLLIGKYYNSTLLAYYNRGQSIPNMVMSSINQTLAGVMFPALSRYQSDLHIMRRMLHRMILVSSYLVFPTMLGLAIVAKPLVLLLLKEKWLPAVPYLQLACIAFAFWPLHVANLQAVIALGRSDIFLVLEVLKKGLILLVLCCTFQHGVMTMVIASTCISPIGIIINCWPNKKLLGYSPWMQIRDVSPTCGICCLMCLGSYGISYIVQPPLLLLVLQIVVGIAIYVGCSFLFKMEALRYILEILQGFTIVRYPKIGNYFSVFLCRF